MNVYYNPQDYGLEIVGELEWSEPCYDFDMTVVWKEKRGTYWIGDDSGCSCPSPFEDITEKDELDGPYTKDGVRSALKYRVQERCGPNYYGYPRAVMEKQVRELLSR